MLWILRFLALGHFAWAGVLLLAAGWSLTSAFMILPHMSTGTIWTNLPGALLLGAMNAFLPATLGIWMVIVGRRLWSPEDRLLTTLFWTHGILLILGSLAVYIGIHSVQAAELSSARGGGLLSPLAWIPLLFGIPVVVLAFLSLVVALVVLSRPQIAGAQSPTVSGIRAAALVLILTLFMGALAFELRSRFPLTTQQEPVEAMHTVPARSSSEILALRGIANKPLREAKAFFQSAVMNGRLGVMRLADQDATLAMVASNIPSAFECIDILEREQSNAMAQIEKQNGIRTRDTEQVENEHLGSLNNMNDLLSALRDVTGIPAGLEPILAYRATRKGAARTAAISLIGKLDLPADKRSWLLFSYVAHGDEEAALAALQALSRMGAQAEPVVNELKRLGQEYWKNPATAALSWSVTQTAEEIEKKASLESSRK